MRRNRLSGLADRDVSPKSETVVCCASPYAVGIEHISRYDGLPGAGFYSLSLAGPFLVHFFWGGKLSESL